MLTFLNKLIATLNYPYYPSRNASRWFKGNLLYFHVIFSAIKRFSLLINYFGCSVQPLSHVRLFVTPWTVARQASLSITNSWSLLKLMSIESVLPSNHLILCPPLLLLSSIFPSIRVFSNESVLHIKWPTIGVSALASVLPMNIQNWFLRIDWLDLLAVQGTLKSLLQHHSSKAKSNLSILCQRTKD